MKVFEVIGTEGVCSFGSHGFPLGTKVKIADDQTNFKGESIESTACVFKALDGDEEGLEQGLLWTDVKEIKNDA